jgi:hypothetical protein
MRTFLRGKVTLLFMTLGLVLAVPAIALADNVVNDVAVDTNGVKIVTVQAGGSGASVGYKIVGTGGDGQTGCNASDGSSAKVTFTGLPSGATATPSDLTFTACNADQSVTFAAGAATTPGDYIIGTNVADSGTGSYSTTPSKFTLRVTAATPSDTTPPDISYVLDPASPDGANGWYKSDVSLTWTVTENESASSLQTTGCEDQNIISDQQETTYSCSATSDGGSAGPVDVKIKRDATNPNVSLVGGPDDGGSYYFGSVPSAPTCDASDDTSGLDGSCSVSGYGTTVGSHTVTASAKDLAGNTNSASHDYDVLAWTLNGFSQPVDMGTTLNTVKGGSTVPLKFEIFAGPTELANTNAIKSFSTKAVTCPGADTPVDEIEFLTTGGTSLRYDTTAGQFIQNWATPKKVGCHDVTMETQDGSKLVAHFRLR